MTRRPMLIAAAALLTLLSVAVLAAWQLFSEGLSEQSLPDLHARLDLLMTLSEADKAGTCTY